MQVISLSLSLLLPLQAIITTNSEAPYKIFSDETPEAKIPSRVKSQILNKHKNTTKVLVKLKPKTSLSSTLSTRVDLQLKRPNIVSLKISENDLHILENDPNVERVDLNRDAYIVDDISDIDNFQERKLTEVINWGVTEVLQDLQFWEQLPTPDSTIKICVCDTGYNLGHPDLPSSSTDVTGFNNPSIVDEGEIR